MRAALFAWMLLAAGTPDDADRARQFNQAAIDAFQAQDFEKALENFQAAFALLPDAKLRLNMAVACERLDRLDEARAQYTAFLSENPKSDKVGDVKYRLGALDKKMRRWGSVTLTVEPAPDEATLGNRKLPKVPVTVWMEPGDYVLTLRKVGFQDVKETVALKGGARLELARTMVAETHADATPTAVIPEEKPASQPAVPSASGSSASEDGAASRPFPLLAWTLRGLSAGGAAVGALSLLAALGAGGSSLGIYGAWHKVPGLDKYQTPITFLFYSGYAGLGVGLLLCVLALGAAAGLLVTSFLLP